MNTMNKFTFKKRQKSGLLLKSEFHFEAKNS